MDEKKDWGDVSLGRNINWYVAAKICAVLPERAPNLSLPILPPCGILLRLLPFCCKSPCSMLFRSYVLLIAYVTSLYSLVNKYFLFSYSYFFCTQILLWTKNKPPLRVACKTLGISTIPHILSSSLSRFLCRLCSLHIPCYCCCGLRLLWRWLPL